LVKLDKTIDNIPTLIDRTVFPGVQGGPHMNTILAKAVAFDEALKPEFKNYAQQVVKNAKTLAGELMNKNYKLVTNGTDNHLMLIDTVTSLGVNGAEAEKALDAVGLTVNKNVIPDDPNPPFTPSGVRLGTPAITTRGMCDEQMLEIAEIIDLALRGRNDDAELANLKERVKNLASKFPLPL
jgi:glycine hydroxymethyltransferase